MGDFWIPRDVQELEDAIGAGAISENSRLEMKAFDGQGKGKPKIPKSFPKSVAGLAVDGGVLILGISERDGKFNKDPQNLTGLAEAVDQSALQAISPPLRVTINKLERPDGTGYLIVIVPASRRAPHMYDGRYYGRGEKTSRVLDDVEVRRLWERNLDRRSDEMGLLREQVDREPLPKEARVNARLFIVAQPISADPRLLLDAVEGRDLALWVGLPHDEPIYRMNYSTMSAFDRLHSSIQRRAHGVAHASDYLQSDRTLKPYGVGIPLDSQLHTEAEIREDGGIRLYHSRVSGRLTPNTNYVLFHDTVANELSNVVQVARRVSEHARFLGSWSFGLALRGIRSLRKLDASGYSMVVTGFSEDEYNETVEIDHSTLYSSGSPVLHSVLGRLFRALEVPEIDITKFDLFPITELG